MCELGYVDDTAYALARSQALLSRGYGKHRLSQVLRADGIVEQDSADALSHADEEAVDSALRFAKRRRIGPFAAAKLDPREREKAIAAMIRAGHSFGIARAIAALEPGAAVDLDALRDQIGASC